MAEYTILEQVKIRLKQFHIDDTTEEVVFDEKTDNPFLEQLIKQAKDEIISKRNYPSDYTQTQIDNDMANYERVIVDLVVYDHSQAGEEYMGSYSENGISRSWKDRDKLLNSIYPIARFA